MTECWITASKATDDGLFGDGIIVQSTLPTPAEHRVTRSGIDHVDRAGVFTLGAPVTLTGNVLDCLTLDLTAQDDNGVFVDGGENRCGCPAGSAYCKVSSAGLSPPEPPDGPYEPEP